ncbi:DNA-binding protein [Paraburkholderia sp. UCT2]|uniref:DNA-binding protein n=1 Tax=Paraburkholderia sp. UCT2 TaxID=2615208 RepID=UPI00165615CA|nr:DNA-binding protein [Paraburkholderia sp. UCT2]MBC8732301.1 transcriptional regulator [Paraburkholderia sp. UCT2]
MARPAAVSAETIRTTVLAMLAEAGDPSPASGARFRQAVSVRKLRARLGAGDPALLSRHLNAIEAECVQAGLVNVAMPDLPPGIAEQMRALWRAAVAVQLDEVAQLRREALGQAETAEAATRDARLRVDLLRAEMVALREQISARDTELATARAELRTALSQTATVKTALDDARAQLAALTTELASRQRAQAEALAAVHARYEGLSRQLLQETAHQRDAWRSERERLGTVITEAQERTRALEGLREQLLADLAREREARQQAAAEAAALAAVVAEQRLTLTGLQDRQDGILRRATPAGAVRRPVRGTRGGLTPADTESAAGTPTDTPPAAARTAARTAARKTVRRRRS